MEYRVTLIPLGDMKKAEGVLAQLATDGFRLAYVIPRDQQNAVVIADRGQEPLVAALQRRAKKAAETADNG